MSEYDGEPELSTDESDRLRGLLDRAAASVQVPDRDVPAGTSRRARSSYRRGAAWSAAAAVVLLGGIGVWLAVGGPDGPEIDAGPATETEQGPPVTISPTVLDETGVWRLPEGLDGFQLAAVNETGFSSGWSSAPGVLAVDSPDDPQRWVLVEAYDQFGVVPASARTHQISEYVTAAIIGPAPGNTSLWFQLEAGDGPYDAVVSGVVDGVDEPSLVAALAEAFAAPGNLMNGEGFDAGVEMLLEALGLTDAETIRWAGDDNHAGDGSSRPSIELTLLDPAGREAVVQIAGSAGTPGWAEAIRFELTGDLSSIAYQEQGLGSSFDYRMVRRNDLGPNVVETTPSLSGWRGEPLLTVFSDDGVMISTDLASAATEPQGAHLTIDEQLQVINSLRSMSEQEFLRRAAASGADVTGLPGG